MTTKMRANERLTTLTKETIANESTTYNVVTFDESKKLVKKYFNHCFELKNKRNNKSVVCWIHNDNIQFNLTASFFDKLDETDKSEIQRFTKAFRNASEIEFTFDCINDTLNNALNKMLDTLDTLDYIINKYTLASVEKKKVKKAKKAKK